MRDDQIRRYARHVLLPEIGGVGQRRLFAATAVLHCASGAGAVAIAYLAAAGVGTLVVEDEGVVAPEDIGALFESVDVGVARREAVRSRVRSLNPDVRVASHAEGPATLVELEPGGDRAADLLAGARAAEAFIRSTARA